jgi:hypothetical protein
VVRRGTWAANQLSKQAKVEKVRANSEIFLSHIHKKETVELNQPGPHSCPPPTNDLPFQLAPFILLSKLFLKAELQPLPREEASLLPRTHQSVEG